MDATRKAIVAVALADYQALQNKYVLHLHDLEEEFQEEYTRRRRAVVTAVLQSRPQVILKSGTEWEVMLDMDDHTFARHFRIRRSRHEDGNE
ncbi:unnamed protein product [Arctogadus glacialis]